MRVLGQESRRGERKQKEKVDGVFTLKKNSSKNTEKFVRGRKRVKSEGNGAGVGSICLKHAERKDRMAVTDKLQKLIL